MQAQAQGNQMQALNFGLFQGVNGLFQGVNGGFHTDKYWYSGGELIINNGFDFNKYKLPDKLKSITIKGSNIIGLDKIPKNIKHIIVSKEDVMVNDNFDLNNLPHGIEIIDANYSAHELVNLPNTLVHLSIDRYLLNFDNLPDGLKYLSINKNFNRTVQNLPDSLKYLNLGESFNKDVNNLPANLTTLILGNKFNKAINNLPIGLKKLVIGSSFKKQIQNLPQLLEHLEINSDNRTNGYFDDFDIAYDNKVIINNLPDSLKTLISTSKYFAINFGEIPQNLKKLHVRNCYLPVNFKYVKIEPLQPIYPVQLLQNLPESIEELILDNPFFVTKDLIDELRFVDYKFIKEAGQDYKEYKDYEYHKDNENNDEDNEEDDDNHDIDEEVGDDNLKEIYDIDFDDIDDKIFADFTILNPNIKSLTLINVLLECKFSNNIKRLTLIDSFINMNFETLPDSIEYLELESKEYGLNAGISISKLPANLKEFISNFKIINHNEIEQKYPNLRIILKQKNTD
jgi:hypothetical protein